MSLGRNDAAFARGLLLVPVTTTSDLVSLALREVDALRDELPSAIAHAIRLQASKPASERGSITLQYGTVEGAFPALAYANVLLDGQFTPVPITMLGSANTGDRVAVLFYPPSGALMIGTVTPAGSGGGGGPGTSTLDWFNVKAFGAVGDGFTNDSVAVQAAANACAVNGGILYFPTGTYLCQVAISSNTQVLGEGTGATILKLPNGAGGSTTTADSIDEEDTTALDLEDGTTQLQLEGGAASGSPSGPPVTAEDGVNEIQLENGLDLQLEASGAASVTGTAVIQSAGFATLTGTNGTGGISEFSIRDLSVDGNKAANGSGTGIQIYGYDFRIDGVRVRNCATDGIYAEWSSATAGVDSMEANLIDVKTHDCGGNGIRWLGPHDSMWVDCISFQNGAAGFSIESNGNALIANACHSWGNSQTIAWNILSQVLAMACTAEGASQVQVLIDTNDAQWVGGQIYAAGGGPTGIQLGVLGHGAVVSCSIYTEILNCTSGAVNFVNDGGNNRFDLLCFQTSGNAIAGSRNAGTHFRCTMSGGGTGTQFLVASGGMNIAGGVSVGGGLSVTTGDVVIPNANSYQFVGGEALYRDSAAVLRTNQELIVGNLDSLAAIDVSTGDLKLHGTGASLQIYTGANGKFGTATLVAGSAQIFTSGVTAISKVFATVTTPGGTLGFLSNSNPGGTERSAGNWFFVVSLTAAGVINTLDTSTFNWWLIEPL